MADNTSIEWTDATWNPIRARLLAEPSRIGWHCEHHSPGCVNCYAEVLNRDRFGTRLPFKPGHRKDVEIFLDEKMLTQPLCWRRPRKIFPCSMTDIFGDFVTDAMLDQMFAVMALTPQHTYQVLTKRSDRMREYVTSLRAAAVLKARLFAAFDTISARGISFMLRSIAWPLPNVWLGVSVEDQARADERIPDLLATPAAVRWLSCEPLLGPVDLREVCGGHCFQNPLTGQRWHDAPEGVASASDMAGAKLDWIVAGGESGHGARPMHPAWARSLRDQCAGAGVTFHFKQWGEWAPGVDCHQVCTHWLSPMGGMVALENATSVVGEGMCRPGKKAAGRLLDGALHDGFPA